MSDSLTTTVRTASPGLVGEPVTLRYELRRELARGGQSIVWVAFDRELGREVAFKMPLPGPDGSVDAQTEARFLREARLTARLDHPNVITVHEFGRTTDGRLFCAQRLVQGDELGRVGTLAEAIHEATTLDQRLALLPRVLAVCNAVAYAHQLGVVHRDLKPDNVVLGRLGETVVLDWGLGRVLGEVDDATPLAAGPSTLDGQVFGTPLYMSPEQARGERDRVGPRSDVWSLGVMLYEVLTGRTPFAAPGRSIPEVIEAVRDEAVPPLLAQAPRVPRALAAVVTRALERDEARRYPDAGALAKDLEAFLDGRAVGVYDYSAAELLRLVVRRNRTASLVGAVSLAVLVVAFAALVRSVQENRRSLAGAYVEKGRLAEGLLRWEEAAVWYAAAKGLASREDAAAGLRVVWPRATQPSRQWAAHEGGVKALVASPDGATLYSAGVDRAVRAWNVSSGASVKVLEGHSQTVNALALSPDGATLFSGSEDNTVRRWDPASGAGAVLVTLPDAVNAVVVRPGGGALAIGCEDGTVSLFEGGALRVLTRHRHPVYTVAFSPNGAWLASGSWDGDARVTDVGTGAPVASLQGHDHAVLAMAFSPDGTLLASAGRDTTVRLWSTSTWNEPKVLLGNTQKVYALAWEQGGELLASAGADGTSRVWARPHHLPLASGSLGRDDELSATTFLPGTKVLVTAGRRGVITVRSLEGVTPQLSNWHDIWTLTELDDGRVAIPHQGGVAFVAAPRGEVTRPPLTAMSSRLVVVTRDGSLAASAGVSSSVTLFDVGTGAVLAEFVGHEGQLEELTFSRDERWLASVDRTGLAFVWDVARRTRLVALPRVKDGLFGAAFAPDGRRLALASYGRTVHVYDTSTWQSVLELRGHAHGVRAVAFSPDATVLASAGWDRSVRLWRVADGAPLATLYGHQDVVNDLSFSPDGTRLASGSHDATIRLWDVDQHLEVMRFIPDEGRVNRVRFSRDGRRLFYTRQALHSIDLVDEKVPASLDEVLSRTGLSIDGLRVVWTAGGP
ncbi:MAG: serine/threonine-protein kinase [Myxococcaceae bacterium]|nr:serine/threonine-protein kinase [Myxococcaceae bacterium]